MTEALARSNNLYFETLGRRLGFERVRHYANSFGLGELAGWNIQGEQLGIYPEQVLPEKRWRGRTHVLLRPGYLDDASAAGGAGSVDCQRRNPVLFAAPHFAEEVESFQPRVKRTLDIANLIPEVTVGMEGAVDYGTARSLRANFNQLPILGKTGTCSNNGTRYGWFASFANTSHGRIVTVFFLEGGRPTFGPKAAELTGVFYHNLWDHSYFAAKLALKRYDRYIHPSCIRRGSVSRTCIRHQHRQPITVQIEDLQKGLLQGGLFSAVVSTSVPQGQPELHTCPSSV